MTTSSGAGLGQAGDPPHVLHVYLDESGGGPVHVGLLRSILRDDLVWDELGLDPAHLQWSPAGWASAAREIDRRIAHGRTIVHAHGVRAAAAASIPVRRRRVPFIITGHGLHSLRRSEGPTALAAWLFNRAVLGSADLVLVFTDEDRRLVVSRRLAGETHVRRIHAVYPRRRSMDRLVARRQLGLPATADVVLWLGRLATEKDPMTFVRAMERVDRGSAVGLIVGDGPLRRELEARAASLGERVRFTGWMNEPDAALSAADVFVGTSRWEALHIAALEAAQVGLPLVLSDCPGNRDLVTDGVPGTLVPPGDEEAFAAEVVHLLEDRTMRDRLGRECISAASRLHTPERCREDHLAAYREVWRDSGQAGSSR